MIVLVSMRPRFSQPACCAPSKVIDSLGCGMLELKLVQHCLTLHTLGTGTYWYQNKVLSLSCGT